MNQEALGLIETRSLAGAIKAIRAATQAGTLVIASAEQSDSGRTTVRIEGTWGAVLAALEAGAHAAEQMGELIAMHIVPKGDQNISPILPYRRFIDRYQPDNPPSPSAFRSRKTTQVAGTADRRATAPATPVRERPISPKRQPRPPVMPPPTEPPHQSEPRDRAVANSAVPSGAGPVDPGKLARAELEEMAVVKLRRLARTVKGLPIQGREISMANRQQLIEAIGSVIRLT